MRLILNGDDFGFSRAVNAGMIDCYEMGVMNSCSMMVNMPGAKQAAELMKEYPGLSVGIHLNLTVGTPLTKGLKTLIKADGTFNKGNLKDSKHVDIEEIRTELQAQLDYFVELTGQLPTHLNSHHGIEMIQGGEEVVCELSQKYHLPVRRFFTTPEGNHPKVDFEMPLMKFKMVEKSQPGDLIELFTAEEIESDNIYEFALHPGYVDYSVMEISSLNTGRAYDAHVFMADETKEWLKANPNITLVGYEGCRKLER